MNQVNHLNRPLLLVEDNPMEIDLTKRAFARCNMANTIEVAKDGEEALACLCRWQAGSPVPLIIILDLKIPKVGGLEVLRQLKSHPQFHTIPVIVLTSSTDAGDIKTAYKLGANSYVVKPMNFDKFLELVGLINTYWLAVNTYT